MTTLQSHFRLSHSGASYYTSNAYIYYSSYNYLPLLQDYKNNTIRQFFYIHEYRQIHEFTSTIVGN